MKKVLLVTILVITNVFLFAQNTFRDFVCKNPFLDELEVYVDKPDLLRGKIFKTVSEEYDLTADGKKVYGDSYSTNKGLKYYFFDKENVLRKKILIVMQNEKIITTNICEYINNDKNYTVKYYNYESNDETIEQYTCNQDNNITTLRYYYDEYELTKIIQINDGEKIKSEQKYDWEPTTYDFVFSKNCCTETDKLGTDLLRTIIYQNGKEIKNIQEGYKDNGQLVVLYDFNKTMTEGIKKTQVFFNGVLNEEKFTSRIVRKYNPAGFVEYEKIIPFEGTAGTYITYTAEILDEEDEFLKKMIID